MAQIRQRAYRLGEKAAYRIAIEDLEAWVEQSVVTPATPATPAPAARPASLRLRVDEQPSVGRLTLTPEMGANRRAQSL